MAELTFQTFIRTFNEQFKACNEIYHHLARHYALSDCAFSILYFLRNEDRPMTQSELSTVLFLSKQTVNSALKKLESNGYIRLESAPGQQKNKLIYLTDRGQTLVEKTIDPVFQVEAYAFSQMAPAQSQALLQLCSQYIQHLREGADHLMSTSLEEQVIHELDPSF